MPEQERSWQVVGPLSGRFIVTDEDGHPRLRRPGPHGSDGRTGTEKANARLILHRTAVFEVLADPNTGTQRLGDLDDTPIRIWAVETNLGQSHTGDLRTKLAARRVKALELLAAASNVTTLAVKITPQGALITGSGTGGIRDVGIELHGTYGWPAIPASSLKGVAAAYARDSDNSMCARIFGTPRPSGGSGAPGDGSQASGDGAVASPATPGSVRFYDALPGTDGVTVAEHVLTPHARDYHTGHNTTGSDERPPPAEYLNPVPIPFLAVEGGTFAAHLVGPEADIIVAADLLSAAVDDIGVGAKTSAGYGYLDATAGPTGSAEPGQAT